MPSSKSTRRQYGQPLGKIEIKGILLVWHGAAFERYEEVYTLDGRCVRV